MEEMDGHADGHGRVRARAELPLGLVGLDVVSWISLTVVVVIAVVVVAIWLGGFASRF
jgi:hypothetical protein